MPARDSVPDDYLSDESHLRGRAQGLVQPRDEAELLTSVRLAHASRTPLVTVSGRTSLTGAAVPDLDVVLDVRALDRIDPEDPSRVGPGRLLKGYKAHVEERGLFYPPDPTSQDTCAIGGNVACNASGALSYLYGPTREYVRGLRVVLAGGEILDIERGDAVAHNNLWEVPPDAFVTPRKDPLFIPAPNIPTPDWSECKNAAGLYSTADMDLVDLFIGSEGILGIVSEVRTRLLPARNPYFAMMFSVPTQEMAIEFIGLVDLMRRAFHLNDLRSAEQASERMARLAAWGPRCSIHSFEGLIPSCMEWFDASTARLLPDAWTERLTGAFGVLYVEQEYPQGSDESEIAAKWNELVELFNDSRLGQDGALRSEAALDAQKIRKMRKDRSAVPERLSESIRPGMVKVGTDFAVPREYLGIVLGLYETAPDHIESYTFGHIGDAHLHVNMLPETDDELALCRASCEDIAWKVVALGGSVSGEHGIGKLKHRYLEMMIGPDGMNEIRRVKTALDPHSILNRNNMIPYQDPTIF